ncbi:hypothetical protein [Pantoea eucrina]|uniref:Lipoprotein n=1 Tax=Pantoea eucrina TaxID=472693 RepID=A0ABU5LCV7_9GAMM|nr:hypothetical protein [Pantoea eucrina]MDZ7277774.1 hypothetical protein [Pantoea eucrina]
MKKCIKAAAVIMLMSVLSGCIIHDGRGPGWHHDGRGDWHHDRGYHRGHYW